MKGMVFKRLLAVAVSVTMVASSSVAVYADETEETVPVAETVEETETESLEETLPSEETVPVEETVPTEETTLSEETVAETEPSEEPYDDAPVVHSFGDPFVFESDLDSDYLAEQFIEQEMTIGPQACYRAYDYMSELSGLDATVFYRLRPHVIAVANGTETSTSFEIPVGDYTARDLGISNLNNSDMVDEAVRGILDIHPRLIFDALMASCPCEMYWFDKTQGCGVYYSFQRHDGVASVYLYFDFVVSENYMWGSDYFSVNPVYGQSVRNAASNARSIVDRYAAYSDYDKLVAYRDAICSMVDYNHYASDNDSVPYGNPWQLIWVFDGDPSTNVVCEGYSKAFQYLCDNSRFSCNDIYAICVTGTVRFTNNGGGHMWNVVHMNDGYNYLVDVTNCDDTECNLFLRGMRGTVTDGYTSPSYGFFYGYDSDALAYYSPAALTLSSRDYDPASAVTRQSGVNMHRLYNPNSGEHFYTANEGERDLLISIGWSYEGIGWVAPARSNTPVYRLYNENGGEHHYTTSVAERNMLVSLGWRDEGIGWYSDDAHTVPLYRQYNPNAFANNHNYTTSLSENNWLVSIGWRAEGIGWYGVG